MNEWGTPPPEGASGQGPGQPPGPLAKPPGEPTDDERLLAAIGHGLTFFEGGLIGPLILYLVKKDDSEFIAFHALQSLYFGLLFLAISVFTCGIGAVLMVLPYIGFEIVATIKAHAGEWYELPIVGKWARDRHPGPAPMGAPPPVTI